MRRSYSLFNLRLRGSPLRLSPMQQKTSSPSDGSRHLPLGLPRAEVPSSIIRERLSPRLRYFFGKGILRKLPLLHEMSPNDSRLSVLWSRGGGTSQAARSTCSRNTAMRSSVINELKVRQIRRRRSRMLCGDFL